MIIGKNDEAKRSKIWGITTIVSSVLIVIIAIYLLMKLFMGNPLEGTWESDDGDLTIAVKANGEMSVKAQNVAEEVTVDVKMSYTIDKETKTISIREDAEELDRLTEEADGAFTREMLENAVSEVVTTFTYNVEGRELTLSEREYGEQFTFSKK